jgi:hypothetical protein
MLPIATTTIAVLRVPVTGDPLDPQPAPAVVASGVRAHISTSNGSEVTSSGASQAVIYFRLACDPTDLTKDDQVRDERTGEVYEVEWARHRQELGMAHVQAGMKQTEGVVSR